MNTYNKEIQDLVDSVVVIIRMMGYKVNIKEEKHYTKYQVCNTSSYGDICIAYFSISKKKFHLIIQIYTNFERAALLHSTEYKEEAPELLQIFVKELEK